MHLEISRLHALIPLVAGITALLAPQAINYIVAIYLIVEGLIGFGMIR